MKRTWKITLGPEEMATFVAGMQKIQEQMIELLVKARARDGYPEARAVIKRIQKKEQ